MKCHWLLVAALVASAGAFGKKKGKEGAAGLREDLAAEEETMKIQQEATGGAREYELENMARHRAGELNTAELGMANMKNAMGDPTAMAEMAEMMQDPENVKAVQNMMADPTFQAQAKKMMAQMPDMSKMMQDPEMMAKVQNMMRDPEIMAKAQNMAKAMYGSGAGAAGGGGAAAELARLRAENAALKGQAFA